MKVIHSLPPNYDQIAKVLHISTTPGLVFTYGDSVYLPSGGTLPDHLEAHESVHIRQQTAMGPEKWWKKYLQDPDFRLSQELEAYIAEYKFVKENYNRQVRRKLQTHIINSLSSHIYGNLVGKDLAYKLIMEGLE